MTVYILELKFLEIVECNEKRILELKKKIEDVGVIVNILEIQEKSNGCYQ